MTETQSVEQIFESFESQFRSDKAQGLTATFQFNITGDDGGTWNAVINDGAVDVNKGEADSPTVTITAASDDWIKIVSGQMNPQMAFMTGKLKVQGDLGLATRLQSLFL
jgi:putative sterol carrier protein